jgi:hypothetical protein
MNNFSATGYLVAFTMNGDRAANFQHLWLLAVKVFHVPHLL